MAAAAVAGAAEMVNQTLTALAGGWRYCRCRRANAQHDQNNVGKEDMSLSVCQLRCLPLWLVLERADDGCLLPPCRMRHMSCELSWGFVEKYSYYVRIIR